MIKLYYEEKDIKIYNEDCLDIMLKMEDKSVDLIITDPPYGVRKKEEWDNKENFLKNIPLWFKEFFRISKLGIIIFCADKMIPYLIKNRENNFQRILIWNKPPGTQFAGAENNNLWFSIEPILIFSKNYDELKKNYNKKIKHEYQFFNARTMPKKIFNHPTTKPITLMKWLIIHYSLKNQLILDPFLGSGTTLAACKELGRKGIGIEISKEYCDIAIERLKRTTAKKTIDINRFLGE